MSFSDPDDDPSICFVAAACSSYGIGLKEGVTEGVESLLAMAVRRAELDAVLSHQNIGSVRHAAYGRQISRLDLRCVSHILDV